MFAEQIEQSAATAMPTRARSPPTRSAAGTRRGNSAQEALNAVAQIEDSISANDN